MSDPLAVFDPRVAGWFQRRFGGPTSVQRLAWPRIAVGENLLITAPTGSGKTLTGFLWPLDRLLTGAWEGGGVRVLYVSPMKALNADIERNLARPLEELRLELRAGGEEPPAVRVGVRSGDTAQSERARMLRRPPEILITTPESLNLLLLSKRADRLFAGLRLVILDEIHAVAGSKRGTHLITAVDRLVPIAGEFQRLAISATARPLERIARFAAGWRLERGAGGAARYSERPIGIVEARSEKRYELVVRHVAAAGPEAENLREGDDFWRRIADDLRERIATARSTLVFTNSRRLAEKTTRFVNESAGKELAWSHHGSLSRELRTAVEQRLKAGSLPAIVATSSLELGIDIGALDLVVLLQSPRSLASAAQRIGRAGHRVGETSRAIFYPTFPRDFLDAAVAARAVGAGEIEPIRPVRAPLDLLAQTILACVARQRWSIDELYDFLRASDPFHELSRELFDLVIEMLAGRYAEARVEELKPRVAVDRLDGTIEGRPGLARLLAQTGGTIPDRGYFQLRIEDSRALLGELDEEFVWERRIGDGFVLGAQAWRIRGITAREVIVAPTRGGALLAPFWRADARDRGAYFAERVAEFLEAAERRLDAADFEAGLVRDHAFEPGAAAELARLLREQRAAQGTELPHRHHVVLEESGEAGAAATRRQVVLYTFWGGTVNRPLALALAALWEEREGTPIETLADDDAILLVLPAEADARALLAALVPERVEELLRSRLESTGFFGAHFRQNAQRALLLPRAAPSRRTPLWLSRQNAKKLLEAVSRFDDFPLVLETWRTCLADEFELDVLRERLRELAAGEIRVSSVRTARPSPFASQLVWRRTNEQMYESDVPEAQRASALHGDLLREVALTASDRPAIPRPLIERFRRKAQRLLPGYPPRDASELLEWVKERLFLPASEWGELLAAMRRESADAETLVAEIADKLVRIRSQVDHELVAAAETALTVRRVPALALRFADATKLDAKAGEANDQDQKDESLPSPTPSTGASLAAPASEAPEALETEALAGILGGWLRYQAPVEPERIAELFEVDSGAVDRALELLVRREQVVVGILTAGATSTQVVSRSTFEALLRWQRAESRAGFEALPLARLPLFVAWHQGLVERATGVEGLQHALERLFGFAVPAGLWERELLPARLDGYTTSTLDGLFEDSELVWFGAGRERVAFAFRADLELFAGSGGAPPETPHGEVDDGLAASLVDALASSPHGSDLASLAEAVGRDGGELTRALWELAWRGAVACDSMRTLRQGVLVGFEPTAAAPPAVGSDRPSRRGSFRRWQASRPFAGRWFAVGGPSDDELDPLAAEQRNAERVRLLLDRWGVLFRELLAFELPALSWSRLSRTLRRMELSGEITGGRFFDGIPGLQFAAPRTLEGLRGGLPESALWWHNAADPSSLAGIALPGLKELLPPRRLTTHLVWRGSRPIALLRRSGREIERLDRAADPGGAAALEPLRVALTRSFDPQRAIEVEKLDGEAAGRRDDLSLFSPFAVTRETEGIRLRRRWS